MPNRGTQTSQLKSVIQVLSLGNKSGILIVTRHGTGAEEGRIAFVQGTMTQIQLAGFSGQQALDRLLRWETCYYVFSEVETNTEPQSLPIVSPLAGSSSAQGMAAPPARSSFVRGVTPPPANNSFAHGVTPPPASNSFIRGVTPPPANNFPVQGVTASQTSSSPAQETASVANSLEQLSRNRAPAVSRPIQRVERAPRVRLGLSSASARVPRRTLQDAESFQLLSDAKLSRLHKHLLLLIDGARNLQDLARVLSHSESEVQELLSDLEHFGIIDM